MAEDNGAAATATAAASFTAMKPQVTVAAQKAEAAAEFYKAAFGAEEVKRSTYPKRKAEQEQPSVLCAELKIGGSSFLVCDQADDSAGAGGLVLRLETDDVAAAVSNAVSAGAAITSEIAEDEDGCCGGVVGKVKDPFGVVWIISSLGKKRCAEPEPAA